MFELFKCEEEGAGLLIEFRPTLSRGGLGKDILVVPMAVPTIGFDLIVDFDLLFELFVMQLEVEFERFGFFLFE